MIGTGPGGSAGGPEMVFVRNGKSWSPRTVRLGVSDFDYSQVLSGLHDGDVVALLGAAVLQAQRDQVNARVRRFTGGGLPGTGSSTTSTKKPAAKPAARPTGPPAAKPAGPAPHGGGGR